MDGAGRTAANPLSLFNGSCRPRRILPCDKMLRWLAGLARRFALRGAADGRRCRVQCLRGTYRPLLFACGKQARWSLCLARRFALRQNATMCGLSRAAFCFAGGLRCLWPVCTANWKRTVGKIKSSKFRFSVRNAPVYLTANRLGSRCVWRGGVFCCGL